MKNASELFNDLDNWRTLKEMKEYYKKIKNICAEDKDYMEMSRIKKGRFKEFLEEFWPLYCFANTDFCKNDEKFKLVIGNQGYDAIIEDINGNQIKLEISSYIDGKLEHEQGKKLNETRMGIVRSVNRGVSEVYYSRIINNMERKSTKNYSGVSLLFVVNVYSYFEVLDFSSKSFVDSLIRDMKKVSHTADHVYLMVFNGEPIEELSENTYLIS